MVTWLLPAALALTQFVVWPGLPLLRGDAIPIGWAIAVTIAAAGVTAGLGLRRRRPVWSLILVSATLAVATLVVPVDDQIPMLLPIAIADLIALFSVAARCPPRTMLLALGGLIAWQGLLSVIQEGVNADVLIEVLISVVVNGVIAALGRIRGRWTRDRAAAARRLVAAEQAQRDAADEERRRLARELHDVTAHHLTSIVVNAQAADLLAAQRPELRDEALSFAARTGRDTLGALRRLVAVLPAQDVEDEAPPLAELAAGFRELGQRVIVDLPDGEPPPALAAAMHGIAREALTNTLRYAPNSTIKISLAYDGESAEFVVEDDGGAASAAGATGLGGGRGVTGMRERAQALGGTLTAGPRDGGGWRVRALLPYAGNDPRKARWLRSQGVIDVGLAALVLALPLGGLLAPGDGTAIDATAATVIALAMVAHVAPVLWRRHAPWWVLLAVVVTAWLGPLLVGVGVLASDDSWVFLFSAGAEVMAVYAVAAWGVRPGLSWLAPAAGAVSSAAALSVLITALVMTEDDPDFPGPAYVVVMLAVLTVLAALALAGPMFASWAAGRAARARRDRRREREESGVASATALAALRARAERARVADGLRAALLAPAEELPRSAENGDLAGVLVAARDALAAMRSLLDGLNKPGPAVTASDQEVASS